MTGRYCRRIDAVARILEFTAGQNGNLPESSETQAVFRFRQHRFEPIAVEARCFRRMDHHSVELSQLMGQYLVRSPPLRYFELHLHG